MGQAIAETLPMAVAIAAFPIPIVAVIVMLVSPRGPRLGPAFLIGWMLGLIVVGGIALFLADTTPVDDEDSGSSTVVYLVKLLVGLLLIVLAYRKWQKRPKGDEPASLPKWMQAADQFTPLKAFGLAAVLSGVNPKNLAFTIAASVTIAQAGLAAGNSIGAFAVFVVVASLGVGIPVVWHLVSRERATATLIGWRNWLTQHNAMVVAIVFLVLGIVLAGQGAIGLSS
jgi:threonine/homoserine/homoserine lactone efflux protein